MVVTYAAACLCNIFYAALVRTLNVVAEWEERVRTECDTRILGNPLLAFLTCQRLWTFREELLPYAILQHIFILVRNLNVDGVVTVGTADAFLER